MSNAHRVLQDISKAPSEVLDPGTGAAIVVDRWNQIIPLTIAGTETNTLAAPLNANQKLRIHVATYTSGARTITVASGINKDGDTTLVFDAAEEFVVLESMPVSATGTSPALYEWRVVASEGVSGGGLLDAEFDSLTAASAAITTAAIPTLTGGTDSTGRVTTTDGVASGTARVVGGRAYSAILATDNLLASAGASAHVDHSQTYSIPANTLKANSVLRIRYQVSVTNDSGTDTLETKLYIGGTTLMTTTAFDPSAATDFVIGEFTLVARAAPGGTASCVGCGTWVTSDTGVIISGGAIMAATNLATNGALVVKVSSKWSATTASTNARLEILNVEIL